MQIDTINLMGNITPEERKEVDSRFKETMKKASIVKEHLQKVPEYERIYFAWKLTDGLVKDQVEKIKKEGLTSNCGNKCHWCCSQPVALTNKEFQHYQQYFSNILKENREYLDKQKSIVTQIRNMDDYSKWYAAPIEQRFCVFLKDKSCSIYNQRPIACRGFVPFCTPKDCEIMCTVDYMRGVDMIHPDILIPVQFALDNQLPTTINFMWDL